MVLFQVISILICLCAKFIVEPAITAELLLPSQYLREVSAWNDLGVPKFDGVELPGFKSRVNVLCCSIA